MLFNDEKGSYLNEIYTNENLRSALHSIYVAQFNAMKKHSEHFDGNHATRMLTSLMGSRVWSWRVVGITPAALAAFATTEFKNQGKLVQRGHIFHRRGIAQALCIEPETALPLADFFEQFLRWDETVLMLKSENPARARAETPSFIEIDKALELFPCGSLVGWQHRKQEVDFLRTLHAAQANQQLSVGQKI